MTRTRPCVVCAHTGWGPVAPCATCAGWGYLVAPRLVLAYSSRDTDLLPPRNRPRVARTRPPRVEAPRVYRPCAQCQGGGRVRGLWGELLPCWACDGVRRTAPILHWQVQRYTARHRAWVTLWRGDEDLAHEQYRTHAVRWPQHDVRCLDPWGAVTAHSRLTLFEAAIQSLVGDATGRAR